MPELASSPCNAAPDFLTPSEAAVFLAISKRTLENYRTRGGGPHFHKFGFKTVRYRRHDLAAWVEAARRRTTSEAH